MECKNKTNMLEIYKCEICGNIVEVVHAGAKALVCCKKPMNLMSANTVDAAQEKHVPVVEKTAHGIDIKVGSVPHPMDEKHYIEWIEVEEPNAKVLRKFFKPGEAAEVNFGIAGSKEGITVRAYCNLHGLWESKI